MRKEEACKYHTTPKNGLITFSLAGVHNEEKQLEARETETNQVGILDKVVLDDDAVQPPQAGDQKCGKDEGEGQHLSALCTKHFSQRDEW